MSQFEPVTLKFNDKEYKVEAEDGIWRLIEIIEDVTPFLELSQKLAAGNISSSKVIRAYTDALNFAGAKTTMSEVREAIGYKDLGAMAGALLHIMAMGQPGADIDLGKLKGTKSQGDQAKKKAKGGSSGTGSNSG